MMSLITLCILRMVYQTATGIACRSVMTMYLIIDTPKKIMRIYSKESGKNGVEFIVFC